MPVDFKLTRDRDIEIDPTGDYATVDGVENIQQQHVNAVYRAAESTEIDFAGIDAETELKSSIESELTNLRYVTEFSVSAETVDAGTIEITVETNATAEPVQEEVEV